jgi:hypothetical protein
MVEVESIEYPTKSEEFKRCRWVSASIPVSEPPAPLLAHRGPAIAANPATITDCFGVYQTVLVSYPIVSIYNMDGALRFH